MQTGNARPVRSVYRHILSPKTSALRVVSANEVRGPFGNGQDRGLGIAGYSCRHHRCVDDTQAGNADYAQPRVDDSVSVLAEAAGANRMKSGVRPLADVQGRTRLAGNDLGADAGGTA